MIVEPVADVSSARLHGSESVPSGGGIERLRALDERRGTVELKLVRQAVTQPAIGRGGAKRRVGEQGADVEACTDDDEQSDRSTLSLEPTKVPGYVLRADAVGVWTTCSSSGCGAR